METMQGLSSFIIQPYRRKYLKEYCHRMSQDNTTQLWDDNVVSVLEEQGFSIIESPRSVYKVEKLYQALAKFAPKQAPVVDMLRPEVKAGVNLAWTCFAKPKNEPTLTLSAFTPKLVYDITSNHKGSAGLTAWGQTKAESYVRAYERGLQQIQGVKKPDPCVAFKRTQFNDKTRLVWGYPYAMTALEGIFARPLLKRFKLGNTPMAFCMTTGALGSKLRVSARHKEFAYSTDVSSFDASIGRALIVQAFNILKTWFDLDEIEPTSGVQYREIWEQVVDYFIYTPIFMPDGHVYKGKKHGVPSGSYFTQMIDSIVNVILVGAISAKFSMHISKEDIYVLGDDILFWSNRDLPLAVIADYASTIFHMEFNANKSAKFGWQETIHYLGRDWEKGVPNLPLDDILIRMSQPETFRKYSKDTEERKRQVRMLLLSYAAVYRNAYPIFIKCMRIGCRYQQTNMSIEDYVYRIRNETRKMELDPDFMSGLVRFKRKYGDDNRPGVPTTLALQFWK